jgi:hypothetical protein
MGAGSSVKVTKSIEVSFVDTLTGKLLPTENIIQISDKVCKEFDYKPSYYDAYKMDKYGKNPYTKYATHLANGSYRPKRN